MAYYDQTDFPRGIVVSEVAVSGAPATIFPATKGRVKIASAMISVSTFTVLQQVNVTLESMDGNVVYVRARLNGNGGIISPTTVVPGFEIPAGGLRVTSTGTTTDVVASVFFVRDSHGST